MIVRESYGALDPLGSPLCAAGVVIAGKYLMKLDK